MKHSGSTKQTSQSIATVCSEQHGLGGIHGRSVGVEALEAVGTATALAVDLCAKTRIGMKPKTNQY